MLKRSSTLIYAQPSQADQQLESLIKGLNCAKILDALKNAHIHASSVTQNNASNAYGVYVWQHGIRTLRDETYSLGCQKDSNHNRELLLSPDNKISIALMRSTKGLCRNDLPNLPTNKNPRGKKFQEMILMQNKETAVLPLFNDESNRQYWVLLHDYQDSIITAELVCPTNMTTNGKFMSEYSTRIFIGAIDMGNKVVGISRSSPKSPQPAIHLSRKKVAK